LTATGDTLPRSASGRSALEIAVHAAQRAGEIILEGFYQPRDYRFKAPRDPVTSVDLRSEAAVKEILSREFPGFEIQAEESGLAPGDTGFRWFVDPLDGTRNFVSGIPHFCAAIALSHGDNVLLAATYDPVRKELFHAEAGKGAYLNGCPISVSVKQRLEESLLGFDMGSTDSSSGRALDMIRALWPGMQSIRVMGSAALGLAYAAAARFDLYFHHHLSPWDVAGGLLLVREAGGMAVDRSGNQTTPQSSSVIVSSPPILQEFLDATSGMEWRR